MSFHEQVVFWLLVAGLIEKAFWLINSEWAIELHKELTEDVLKCTYVFNCCISCYMIYVLTGQDYYEIS